MSKNMLKIVLEATYLLLERACSVVHVQDLQTVCITKLKKKSKQDLGAVSVTSLNLTMCVHHS